jgi:hypothetical protein
MRSVVGTGLSVSLLCVVLAGPAGAQTAPAPSDVGTRELIEAAKATAKATREAVDYARVTPDILAQILAKLDKIEDKLGKVENAVKAQQGRRAR